MAITINTKIVLARWTGTTITLPAGSGATTAAPWVTNVDKIVLVGPRNATTGINSKTVYTGKYGGKTPGGVLSQLVTGETYEFYTGGNPVVSWSLPDAVRVKDIIEGAATVPAPTITSFTPTSGPTGTSVTITGTNLANAYAVVVSNVVATGLSDNTATSITATVPALAATGTIKVYTAGGVAISSTSFTVANVVPQLAAPANFQATATSPTAASLAWSAVPNATSYVVQRSLNTAFTDALTTIYTGAATSTNNVSGLAGATKYFYRVKGQASGYTDSEWALDDVLMPAAPVDTELLVTNSVMQRNLRTQSTTNRSALAGVKFTTDAPYVDVQYISNGIADATTPYGLASFVNGAFGQFFPTTDAGTLTQRFTLSGTGSRIVEITEGLQASLAAGTPVDYYCRINKIIMPAGSIGTLLNPSASSDVLVVNSDSTGVGTSASIPQTKGWAGVLQGLRPGLTIFSDGWANKRIDVSLNTPAKRAAIIAEVEPLASTAGIFRYGVALGTNDMRDGKDATLMMSYVGALADEMRASYPNVDFYVQKVLDYGSVSDAYRAAAAALYTGREEFVTIIECGAVSLADQNHPNDAGYASMAASYDAQLKDGAAALTFSPSSGDAGTVVELIGSGFSGAQAVKMNGVPISGFVVNNDAKITLTIPLTASSGTFEVVTPGGLITSTSPFTIVVGALRDTLLVQDANTNDINSVVRYSGVFPGLSLQDFPSYAPFAYGTTIHYSPSGQGYFEITVPAGYSRLVMEGYNDSPGVDFDALVNGIKVGEGTQRRAGPTKDVYFEFTGITEGQICRLSSTGGGTQFYVDQFRFEP